MYHKNYTFIKQNIPLRRGVIFLSFVFLVLIILSGSAFAQIAKLTVSDSEPDDNFGYSLALSDTTIVVGAWQNDSLLANSGAAYVFERVSGSNNWNQVIKLIPDNADFAGDEFGKAVAIDGNWLIIGAQFDDYAGKDRGSAYVFERTPNAANAWSQAAKLTAEDSAFRDFFGQTVAISGTRAVVGAPEDDDFGNQSGSAYVFERNPADGSWNQVAKLTANDGEANDIFGSSVTISGETIIVGANEHSHQDVNNNGAAYVFQRNPSDGSWDQVAKLTASDGDELDRFGFSVALIGDRALIGAPFDDDSNNVGGSAYVFERTPSTNTWSQTAKLTAAVPKLGNQFGRSVALAGEQALIGAPEEDDFGNGSGSVYLFQQSGSSWSQLNKLIANDGAAFDLFGSAVSLSEELIFIGAHDSDNQGKDDSGSVYIFQLGF